MLQSDWSVFQPIRFQAAFSLLQSYYMIVLSLSTRGFLNEIYIFEQATLDPKCIYKGELKCCNLIG